MASAVRSILAGEQTAAGFVIKTEGLPGCRGITTCDEKRELQPNSFVTLKVYDPGGRAEITVFAPVPVFSMPPGLRINVHGPVAGSPLSITLPVDRKQVGGVIVPATGVEGVDGGTGITTFAEKADVHPGSFVIVK